MNNIMYTVFIEIIQYTVYFNVNIVSRKKINYKISVFCMQVFIIEFKLYISNTIHSFNDEVLHLL